MEIRDKQGWNDQLLFMLYKIIGDIFFLSLVVLGASLLVEAVLPGILSSRLSFFKITIFLLLVVLAMIQIGKIANLKKMDVGKTSKKVLVTFVFFTFVLTTNSLLKFGFLQSFIISLAVVLAVFYFYLILLRAKE